MVEDIRKVYPHLFFTELNLSTSSAISLVAPETVEERKDNAKTVLIGVTQRGKEFNNKLKNLSSFRCLKCLGRFQGDQGACKVLDQLLSIIIRRDNFVGLFTTLVSEGGWKSKPVTLIEIS